MVKITNNQIIEYIKTMTALQLKELVSAIEETFQVTPTVAATVAPVQEVAAKSTTTVSLFIKEVGGKKVDVIKAVKAILGVSTTLMDAKKIVDAVATGPQKILENIDSDKAKEHETVLKVAGATVEIK